MSHDQEPDCRKECLWCKFTGKLIRANVKRDRHRAYKNCTAPNKPTSGEECLGCPNAEIIKQSEVLYKRTIYQGL